MRAWHLSQQGWSQRDIADALDVSPGAISQWLAAADCDGPQALCARPRLGPAGQLALDQRQLIADFLWHGPEAYGFRGEVWTCARVAEVLAEEFGVRYHKGHVSRLLKRLGWTPQVPVTRAFQRNEEAIDRWRREVWPGLLGRARQERRTLVFVDEAGFYLLPAVVRTYSPRGQTPVIYEWQSRDHLSVMGALTPRGKVYTLARQEALTGLHSVALLEHLLRQISGRLLVLWDNSPIHRRAEVKEFLSGSRGRRIHLEALPAYAPELNPVEWAWQHLKNVEMRNLVCVDLEQLHEEFHMAVGRLRQKPHLIRSFFTGAGLKL